MVDLYPSEGETEAETLFAELAELRPAEAETVPWFVASAQGQDEQGIVLARGVIGEFRRQFRRDAVREIDDGSGGGLVDKQGLGEC